MYYGVPEQFSGVGIKAQDSSAKILSSTSGQKRVVSADDDR